MTTVKGLRPPLSGESGEWRAGGRTVLFGALGYGAGPILFLTTASVFIKPTMEATGWTTTEVLISPIVTLLFTFFGPLVGRVVDRRGVRRTVTIGLVPYVALLVLFAASPINRFTFYALAVGIGMFGAFGYLVPYYRAAASWFDKGAGKAFGIIGVGGAAMPLIGIPLVTLAIYGIGWKAGYLVLAAFALLLALPAAFFGVKERIGDTKAPVLEEANGPEETVETYASVKQVLRTPRYWIFALHILLIGGAAGAFLSNMQPIMLNGGLSVAAATGVTTLFTAGIVVGRLATGVLLDLINRYRVAVFVFLLSALGSLTLMNVSFFPVFLIAIAALLTAFSSGAEGDVAAYFILKEYGRANFGTLYATAGVFGGIGSLTVPYVFSLIVDGTGTYSTACAVGAALYVVGALSIISFGVLGRRQSRRSYFPTT